MKTILLTSSGFNGTAEEILKILLKPIGEIKLSHITTASKVQEDTSYVARQLKVMEDVGFTLENIQELDIEGKTEEELRELLSGQDIIFVQGGNTFYLLKAIRESGFDKVVEDLIGQGVIYIGVSAGSYVACPTIEVANWKGLDENVVELKDLTAMNLVPFNVFVHYQPSLQNLVKEKVGSLKEPLRILSDNQALLIRDGKVDFIGQGSEIKI